MTTMTGRQRPYDTQPGTHQIVVWSVAGDPDVRVSCDIHPGLVYRFETGTPLTKLLTWATMHATGADRDLCERRGRVCMEVLLGGGPLLLDPHGEDGAS